MKKKTELKTERNRPWLKFYPEEKRHLEFPDETLYDMLARTAVRYPNQYALNYFGTMVTYQELLSHIEACAKALKAMGVEKGDVVTICMPNTPEAVYAFYALNRIGAIASMIHPLSAENEIKHYLTVSDSTYLITIDLACEKVSHIVRDTMVKKVVTISVKDSMPKMLGLGYHITQGRKIKQLKENYAMSWQTFMKNGENYSGNTYEKGRLEDAAVILYSGGTTGAPKGIILANRSFNAAAVQNEIGVAVLGPGDKVLSIMPIFHGFGLGICIHTVLTFGGTSILLPQFSAKTFDKLLSKYQPNVLIGVPTLYEALLGNKKIQKMDLSYLKVAISGGDSLSVALKKKVDTFFQERGAMIQIREGYGLTECLTGSCLTPPNDYRDNSIGIPYPENDYAIVKPNTYIEVPYGEEGEIVISGPTVMMGYLKDENETNHILQVHEDGRIWLHTGDLGSMDSDGFVYFRQRLKRMIVSSGYNVYPQYIENVIDSHPSVSMTTVVGVDHPYKIQVAKAFVVLKDGVEASEELKEEIMEHCKKNLAKYSLPYEIEFRASLPKTLVGKVAYQKLEEEERNKQKAQ